VLGLIARDSGRPLSLIDLGTGPGLLALGFAPYAGRVVKLTHKGPYATITQTYDRIHAYTKEKNLREGTVSWEEYVNDPGETAEDDLLTNVYVVLKD
jgi:hypothetical protein